MLNYRTQNDASCSFAICRDIERKMTTRDFMEYPNASADVDSLEEVVMYQQSGRKPVGISSNIAGSVTCVVLS